VALRILIGIQHADADAVRATLAALDPSSRGSPAV
jgi:hypothetical protein